MRKYYRFHNLSSIISCNTDVLYDIGEEIYGLEWRPRPEDEWGLDQEFPLDEVVNRLLIIEDISSKFQGPCFFTEKGFELFCNKSLHILKRYMPEEDWSYSVQYIHDVNIEYSDDLQIALKEEAICCI